MVKIAARADVPVSSIRQIFQQLPLLRRQRAMDGLSPLIDLSIGQPHIPPHPEVLQSYTKIKEDSRHMGYSPAQGEPETLEAIVRLYQQYYPALSWDTSEVIATVGASGALSVIFSILVEKKTDVILAFEPCFGAYQGQVHEWGGTFKAIPTQAQGYRPTAQALEKSLQAHPGTKAVILNFPCNPSGVSLRQNEAEALADVLTNYPDVLIIVDDVYRDFNTLQHVTVPDVAPFLKDRCVIINSGAKGLLGAPGERVGMMSAHPDLIQYMIRGQTNRIASVPWRTQALLRAAVDCYLQKPDNPWLAAARKEYRDNVLAAATAFTEQGFTLACEPEGGFYLLIKAKHLLGTLNPFTGEIIQNDVDLASYFLRSAESGVATVPGSGFFMDPAEGCLRISCAADKSLLLAAAKRMGLACQRLLEERTPS